MTAAHPEPSCPLRLGTRGSALALAQARLVVEALQMAHGLQPGAIETRVVQTAGDRVQDRRLAEIGGKALWTRELDGALIAGEIDLAVHSMKDVETILAQGIALAAVLPRADPRDRLVGAASIADIPFGTTVGTSSPRREAQLRNRRPDVKLVVLRGNVQTRLRHVGNGTVAATFLAAAGLDRLGIGEGATLQMEDWLPAASQGVVGIACRADDAGVLGLVQAINHPDTMLCMQAERALLAGLGGSCHTAVAAHASLEGGLMLRAELLSPDGRDRVTGDLRAGDGSAEQLGHALARALMSRATPAILRSLEPAGVA
ncbi:MAG: hydroxymethylbilane synthase [Sandarakinorhabdus sp.]|nr:hydroxymethylbilane synthase [Sandarakinorhabdus sp.]